MKKYTAPLMNMNEFIFMRGAVLCKGIMANRAFEDYSTSNSFTVSPSINSG